jgi:hypothetical protein
MTHTPGPWWVDEDGDYLCVCEGEVNDCGEREEIATLACNRPSHRHCQPDNARLIAAAPELLAACKRLARDLDMVLWKDGCGYTLCGSPSGALNYLLDVIAKAEGRE